MKGKAIKLTSVKRSAFMLLLFVLTSVQAFAQGKDISGVIKDATGETAIGATVKVKGTTIGTITDFNGAYTLKNVPADAKELEISYVGFSTKVVAISGAKVDVTLKEDTKVLEAVVVTGYGETAKRDLVTSVASVGAKDLKDIPVSSAAEALQGKLTGVSVTTSEGSPDADIRIRVRGGSSLTQSSDPLYIVDGFPVSSISDISPTDIQSMDVLKDAAATAIYGAQGANGVIIITTKDADLDGKDGDCSSSINVDYTGYIGWKEMSNKYDMLKARDFTLMQYEFAYLSDKSIGKTSLTSKFNTYFDQKYIDNNKVSTIYTDIDKLLDYWGAAPEKDWQDETFGNKGSNSNHNLTISGGNKNANFNLSYNRIDDEGIMYKSNYIRNNLSLKSKFKPAKGLTIGTSVRYSNTEVLGSGANTADDAGSKTESRVRNAVAYTPITLLEKDQTSLDDEESFGSLYDPITTVDDNYKNKIDDKFTLNAYVAYKFLKKFTVRSEAGYELRFRNTDRYYGPTAYYSRAGDGFSGAGGDGYGSVIQTKDKSSKFRNANTLEFKDKIKGGHSYSVLVGEESVVNKGMTTQLYGYGYEATYEGDEVFNMLSQNLNSNIYSYVDQTDNMLSFFGRANYDFRGRYYLSATMRADATTRFAAENRWGYFPAAAAAWRMSDETWMRGFARTAKISNMKMRLSYGVAGNNNVDLGSLNSAYDPANTSYLSPSSFYNPNSIMYSGGSDKIAANPKLKWETTTTRNLGLDYGFFNDRLSGTVDVYLNTTSDLIILRKISQAYNYQFQNVGATENKGAEFSVNAVILDKKSKDLNYGLNLSANISANRSKVTDLGGMENYPVATGYFSSNYNNSDAEFMLEVGEPIGRVYGFVYDGWYTTDDFTSYDKDKDKWYAADGKEISTILGTAMPGTMKLKDLSGDGKVSLDEDRTIIGNTLPDFTGGFSLSGRIGGDSWGTVDVSANFTYSYGNDVVNLTALDLTTIFESSKLRNNLSSVAYGSRYSLFAANGSYLPKSSSATGLISGADYEALSNTLKESNAGASIYNPVLSSLALTDQLIEDGSFLRMSSLTVGYSLPKKVLKKALISNARIFFTASNLFILTNYSGSDPEVDTGTKRNPLAIGVDWSAYPRSRAFNFGLNLSF